MHECPECGQACDCDGEDTWFDWPYNLNCEHECEEFEDDGDDFEMDAMDEDGNGCASQDDQVSFFDYDLQEECTDGRLDYCEFGKLGLGELFFWLEEPGLLPERFVKISRISAVSFDNRNQRQFKRSEMCMYWGREVIK